jgi:hypothetical protein
MDFNPELIKSFVKSDLGCECPDDVFNYIKFEKNARLEYDFKVDYAITIGNRLLIFIQEVQDIKQAEQILEILVRHGKSWRDDEDLNRFRLVVVTSSPKKMEKKIFTKFNKLKNKDEKVHLHVLSKKKLDI